MESCKESEAIAAFVAERGIMRLVHFTPYMNLISIFRQKALWPAAQLARYAAEHPEEDFDAYVRCNDKLRLDGRRDCINLSIQHINHCLFMTFKRNLGNGDPWCILEIDPMCMQKQGCVFTIANAASSDVKRRGSGSGVVALRNLFRDRISYVLSYGAKTEVRTPGLDSSCPTSAQAEVLFPGVIPLELVKGLVFESTEDMRRAVPALEMLLNVYELPIPVRVCADDFIGGRE